MSFTPAYEDPPPFKGLETYQDWGTGAYSRNADFVPIQLNYTSVPLQTFEPAAEASALNDNQTVQAEPTRSGFSGPRFNMPSDSKACLCLILLAVAVVLALIAIIVPISFSTLEYFEMGFKRRRTTGTVDLSKTYEDGIHFIGPDYEFKTFPAGAHFEAFRRLSVFNADRLEVHITARLQYFLRPHQLTYLHKKFDLHYRPVLEKNAKDALKGAATMFTNREMILQREKIEAALFKTVRERLGGRCCEKDCWKSTKPTGAGPGPCVPGCKPYDSCTEKDFGLFAEVRYFQLGTLEAPSGLNERYLRALTLQEENEREQLRQQGTVIRKDTDQLVAQKENVALETSMNATAQSSLFASRAVAEAKSLLEKARSEGLKHLYSELGITTTEQKTSFDYLRTLRKQRHVQLAVDYSQLVSMGKVEL